MKCHHSLINPLLNNPSYFKPDNDFLCKNYILNGLLWGDLYDNYSSCKTAKELWDELHKKYDTEKAGAKKLASSRYL